MPKVGFGFTTYKDIRSLDFGLAFYEALAECSPKLLPFQSDVLGEKFLVESAETFASHWCNEIRHTLKPKYGTAPANVPPRDYGSSWRTKGSLSGRGQVFFGGDDPAAPSTITFEHSYATRLDWAALFRTLLRLLEPSHGNLHIFTERELQLAGEGRFAFQGPIIGEGSFTHWKTTLGSWRGPDRWEIAARRRYRFLPELAWGNFLGTEFSGRFDRQGLLEAATVSAEVGDGVFFQVTDEFSDIVSQPSYFEKARAKLKRIFAHDVFRSD